MEEIDCSVDCLPHPSTVTKQYGGGYGVYQESKHGRNALPFAMAEKIDNSIKAIINMEKDESFSGLIKVCIMLDDAEKDVQNIVFWDNGCGMDQDDIRAYATYSYSQEARENDAANERISPSKIKKRKNQNDPKHAGDPLVLTGNIGHFGVGAQHSTFFMGHMEHIMSRAVDSKGPTPVQDIVIDGDAMHEKWITDRKNTYNFPRLPRALGEMKFLRECEKHRGITQLIKNEKDKARDSFSLFIVSKIHKENWVRPNMKRVDAVVEDLVKDVARIYNYYLHGTDDDALESSDDESEESDDDDDDEQDAAAKAPHSRLAGKRKAKGGAGGGKKSKNRRDSVEGNVFNNLDVQFIIEGKEGVKKTINLRDEVKNVELQMRRKHKSSFTYNLLVPDGGPDRSKWHKVTVRLYYFPKILDRETRPCEDHEQEDYADKPILSCYWEGRWIPDGELDNLKIFTKFSSQETRDKYLLGRLRGSVFFPHSFIPSNNKLKFLKSPQTELAQDSVCTMKEGLWENNDERSVAREFSAWIKKCHEDYDQDIKFIGNPTWDARAERTYYSKLKYGQAEFEIQQKVVIKVKPRVVGQIKTIFRKGKHTDEATSEGYIEIRRFPIEVFGESEKNLHEYPITYLSSNAVSEEDRTASMKQWNDKVQELTDMLPFEILVAKGRSDEHDEMLAQGKTRVKFKTKENCQNLIIKNAEVQREIAGFATMNFDVVILNKAGKAVKQDVLCRGKLSAGTGDSSTARLQNKKMLTVHMEIKCTSVQDTEEFQNHVGWSHANTQNKQSADLSFEFPYQTYAFEIAGTYDLTFKVIGPELFDCKGNKIVIEWKQQYHISPNIPATVDIISKDADSDAPPPLISFGCEKPRFVECCFRDEFGSLRDEEIEKSKNKQKGARREELKGNRCKIRRKGVELEIEEVKPIGLDVKVTRTEEGIGDCVSSWSVTISPRSRDLDWLHKQLSTKVTELSGQCTLVFKYKESKKKHGNEELTEVRIEQRKFKFRIEAGQPHELRLSNKIKSVSGEQEALQLEVLNRGKVPEIMLQVVDKWGCLVAKYNDEPLKVQEQLVYKGDKQEVRARTQRKQTLDLILHEVDDVKAQVKVGGRIIALRDPLVREPENHHLVCTLLNKKGEPLDKYIKIKNSPLEVAVLVKPSRFPVEVCVWVGDEKVRCTGLEKGFSVYPVPTTAGSKQANIKFGFLDEAGRSVSLKADDGWSVSGGGWDNQSIPCVCEQSFVKMPPLLAREKAGDAQRHTIIFQGPDGAIDARPIQVHINLVPIAGKPHHWVMAEAPKPRDASASAAAAPMELQKYESLRPLDIKCGQPLREVICIRIEDKNGNIVPLTEHHTSYLPMGILVLGPHKEVSKVGVWDTLQYDARSDSFLFDPSACLKGSSSATQFEIRISSKTAASTVEPYVQKVQLMPGLPYRVRLQLKGFPSPTKFVGASEDKDDGASSSHASKTLPAELPARACESETSSTEDSKGYEGWPTVCIVDELSLEIVDEAGNLVTGAMEKGNATVTVALRGAKIAHVKDKGKNKSKEQEPPRFKEELEALEFKKNEWCKKLKRVLIAADPDTKAWLEASVRIPGHDDIKKASKPIAFVATNIVQRIELVSDPVPEHAQPGDRVSVRARLHTQDGLLFDGNLGSALSCKLIAPDGTEKQLEGNVEAATNDEFNSHGATFCHNHPEWVGWVVDEADRQRSGSYTISVSYRETRDTMEPIEFLLPAVSKAEAKFSVLPGASWFLEIQSCLPSHKGDITVSNVQGNNLVAKEIRLQILDRQRNCIRVPRPDLKVVAFVAHPRAPIPLPEIVAELDFYFVNDAHRQKQLQELRAERREIDEQIKVVQDRKAKMITILQNLERDQGNAVDQLRAASRDCERLSALPPDIQAQHLESKDTLILREKLQHHVDYLKSLPASRVLQMTEKNKNEITQYKRDYGEMCLGLLGQLITVEDDEVARFLSSFRQKPLLTVICVDSDTKLKAANSKDPRTGRRTNTLQVISLDLLDKSKQTYINSMGQERIYVVHPTDPRFEMFPNINEMLLINQIEFRDPSHEYLRFQLAQFSAMNLVLVLNGDLQHGNDYSHRMKRAGLSAKEIWCIKSGRKLSSYGATGGADNAVRSLQEMERAIRLNHDHATILLPSPDECAPKIDAVERLLDKMQGFSKLNSHLRQLKQGDNMNSKMSKCDEDIKQLRVQIEGVDSRIENLRVVKLDKSSVAVVHENTPPRLCGDRPLPSQHGLLEHGALDAVRVLDLSEHGQAVISDLRLQEGVGSQDDSCFTLRFVLVRTSGHGEHEEWSPVMRDAPGTRVVPNLWPEPHQAVGDQGREE